MSAGTNPFETTAAEISRNFGRWQDRALEGPVKVTHHGRPRVVIVSAAEFERLLGGREDAFENAAWTSAAKAAESALSALMDGLSEGFIGLDASLRITAVNRVVAAFLECGEADLIGRHVGSIGDPTRAEVFLDRYRWVLRTGEAATFESTVHIRKDRTLRVRAFPFRQGVGVVFTNLTELAALRASASDWNADGAALSGHPGIAIARLNAMGFITTANTAFLEFVGFSAEQVAEVRLTDLVVAADRLALAQAINDLLQQKRPLFAGQVDVLTRDRGRRTMTLSMAPRLRDLVLDGVSLVGLFT